MADTQPRLPAFAGSLRHACFNRRLIRVLAEGARAAGAGAGTHGFRGSMPALANIIRDAISRSMGSGVSGTVLFRGRPAARREVLA